MKFVPRHVCVFVLMAAALPLTAQTNIFPSSGNVGIGTTSPTANLDIQNGANGASLHLGAATLINATYSGGNGGTFNLQNWYNSVWVSRLYMADNGNIGVGTTNPYGQMEIYKMLPTSSSLQPMLTLTPDFGSAAGAGFGSSIVFRGRTAGNIMQENAQIAAYNENGSDNGYALGLFTRPSSGAGLIQNLTILRGGNVGIGTTNPISKLQLEKTANDAVSLANSFFFFADTPLGAGLLGQQKQTSPYAFVLQAQNQTNNAFFPISLNPAGGNVGVGTTTPEAPLDVNGSIVARGLYSFVAKAPNGYWGFNHDNFFAGRAGNLYARGFSSQAIGIFNGSTTAEDVFLFNQNDPNAGVLVLKASGNVGIGTTNPSQKLSVNGTIRAKEMIVDTGWSDYVFADEYRLAPLAEVESHIKSERHLPGIPSAAEVAEHGVSMGEMQAKLLAKIEELTLHQIEQEKRLAAQQSEITALKTEVTSLTNHR